MKQIAKTSEKLRTNLSDDYTTEENKYPTSRQETLHYLENHSKSIVRAPIAQEDSLFAQRKGNRKSDTFDKNYWKYKESYKCGYKRHPASHCKTKFGSNRNNKKKDDDSSSVSSKSSAHTMVDKMKKDLQNTKKSFAAIECMIKNIKEEEDNSDIFDSYSESGSAFFQMECNIVSSTETDILTKIILHNQAKLNDPFDLNNVILLDNQSTLDLICNKKLTSKINKSDKNISVQGNRVTLTIKYNPRIF